MALAWNPNGQILATGGFGTVQLWNPDNGKLRLTLFTPFSRIDTPNAPSEATFPQGNIDSLSWSPEGQTLAIAGEDRTIHLWDVDSQRITRQIKADQGWIKQLSWSPDGQRWAVLGENIRLKLWDAKRGKAIKTLSGFEGSVVGLSWHLNNKTLAIALNNGGIELWDVTSGAIQPVMEPPTPANPAQPAVSSVVAWNPNGQTLTVGRGDRLSSVKIPECSTIPVNSSQKPSPKILPLGYWANPSP